MSSVNAPFAETPVKPLTLHQLLLRPSRQKSDITRAQWPAMIETHLAENSCSPTKSWSVRQSIDCTAASRL